jgi:hypothetical protein
MGLVFMFCFFLPQTSDMTFETAGSSHLHHAIAARVFKMFCLGMRVSESMPAFSIPQLTEAQLVAMLDSPESFMVCFVCPCSRLMSYIPIFALVVFVTDDPRVVFDFFCALLFTP